MRKYKRPITNVCVSSVIIILLIISSWIVNLTFVNGYHTTHYSLSSSVINNEDNQSKGENASNVKINSLDYFNDSTNVIDSSFIKRSTHLSDLIAHNSFGANITIALVSSGIANNSLYYNQSIYNFNAVDNTSQPNDHDGIGTILAAFLVDKEDGLCPNASLMNIKVMDGITSDEWIAEGINKAISRHANIILLGINDIGSAHDRVVEAILKAVQNNIPVVVPSGDYGPSFGSLGIGAFSSYALVVGAASHKTGLKQDVYDYDKYFVPDYSSRGPGSNGEVAPHIVSLGSNILTPHLSFLNNSNVTFLVPQKSSSTLFAATTVAAGIACIESLLLKDNYYNIPVSLLVLSLLQTAFSVDSSDSVYEQGNGYVNLWDAYVLIKNAIINKRVVDTIFPRQILGEPYVYYNQTSSINFAFIDQKIPINILHYCYNPLMKDFSYAKYSLVKEKETGSLIHYSINKTDFTGIMSYSTDLTISPYYQKVISINIYSPLSYIHNKLSIKLAKKLVSFDVSHDTDGYYFGDTPYANYWTLTKLFAMNDIKIQTIKDFEDLRTDLLILADPEIGYSQYESEKINNYINTGGLVLFIAGGREFLNNAFNQSSLQYNATDPQTLSEISSCGLAPTTVKDKQEVFPIFKNLMQAKPFWFINPLILEDTFVNKNFFRAYSDSAFISRIIASGYDISIDPNSTSITSLIGLDWVHDRGIKLAIEKKGKGELIISSTEQLFTVYGQYFSKLLFSSQYNISFVENYVFNQLFKNQVELRISQWSKLSLIGSNIIFQIKLLSEGIKPGNVSAKLTAFFLTFNESYVGKRYDIPDSLIFTLVTPLFYRGTIKVAILINADGFRSVYYESLVTIKLSPLAWDIITVLVIALAIIVRYTFKVVYINKVVGKISKKTKLSKKYCQRCKLPLTDGNVCHFCHYENK